MLRSVIYGLEARLRVGGSPRFHSATCARSAHCIRCAHWARYAHCDRCARHAHCARGARGDGGGRCARCGLLTGAMIITMVECVCFFGGTMAKDATYDDTI